MLLAFIIIFSLVGGVFSLIGGVFLLLKKSWSHETMLILISGAAGVLLTVAFGDLLPKALETGIEMGFPLQSIFFWTLGAMVLFFLFERSFFWFHHHHGPHDFQPNPLLIRVWLGDTLHNFLDGIVITASFLVSIPLGITTALAVAAHEIPQEVADFSLFLSKGMKRKKILLVNTLSAFATTIGAVLAFAFWDTISVLQPQLLAFTAGMFIYIAGSDLIPELHHEFKKQRVWLQTTAFLVGIFSTSLLRLFLE